MNLIYPLVQSAKKLATLNQQTVITRRNRRQMWYSKRKLVLTTRLPSLTHKIIILTNNRHSYRKIQVQEAVVHKKITFWKIYNN